MVQREEGGLVDPGPRQALWSSCSEQRNNLYVKTSVDQECKACVTVLTSEAQFFVLR